MIVPKWKSVNIYIGEGTENVGCTLTVSYDPLLLSEGLADSILVDIQQVAAEIIAAAFNETPEQ